MSSKYTAGPQTLGYLYQSRYALYLILTGSEDAELSLEKFDDISFDKNGSPKELLQLKHHIDKKASLTDKSPDLWKTIRVWSENINQNKISVPQTVLSLITTASTPDESIASLLRLTPRYKS